MGVFVELGAGAVFGTFVPLIGAILADATDNCLCNTDSRHEAGLIGSITATTFAFLSSNPTPFALALRATSTAMTVFLSVDETLEEHAPWTPAHTTHTVTVIAAAEVLAFFVHPALGAVTGVILGYFWAPTANADYL